MGRIVEFRIVLPMTLDEYHRGSNYALARTTELNASASEGFETLTNEPFTNPDAEDPRLEEGVYTVKILHLGTRAPKLVRVLTPKNMLMLEEKSWNCFPYIKTVYTSPFFGPRFELTVETMVRASRVVPCALTGEWQVCDDDRGTNPNALGLSPEKLKQREVDWIDIVCDPVGSSLVCKEDPTTFKSKVTGRGPLSKGFERACDPAVCVYKVVTCNLDFGPFQRKAESLLLSSGMRDLLLPLHRQIFCWIDEWHAMSMEQIKAYELQVQARQNAMGFATGGLPAGPAQPAPVGEIEPGQQVHTPDVTREQELSQQLHTPDMPRRKDSTK